MKIAFIGDPHLDYSTPISRLDNYKDLTIEKLNSLYEVCIKKRVTKLFLPGDVFHKVDQSATYLHDVINAFNKFNDKGIEVYSIWGNHDLKHNNISMSDKTPLSLLFKTNVIKRLDTNGLPLKDKALIFGLDFSRMDEVGDIKTNPTKTNILVMHYATDNTVANESIGRDLLTNFDLVMSGHDHTYYGQSGTKPIVLRPGSFTRRTKEDYNLTRNIYVDIYNVDTKEIEEVALPNVKPAEEVFKNEVFLDKTEFYNFYSKSYNELFTDDYFKSEAVTLEEMIDELPATVFEESKEIIKEAAREEGLISNN